MDGNITNIKKVQINQRARHGVGKIIMDLPVLFMLVIVCIIMASLNNNFLSATNMISMFTS